ncbi:MAG: FAD-dependent oxidoreductase [Burkholderiaceae bacterium]|nr:FAD-dependent oxidoreductase [Burkholderiaceae bacterium]
MKHVAVIGAGIAGIATAAGLQAAGHAVTLFEKSRGPGGRCATRRSAAGNFNHGAPDFLATTAAFRTQVLQWHDAGWVGIDGESGASPIHEASPLRAFGLPSMNALAQQLAAQLPAGVELRFNTHVTGIESARDAGNDHAWRLRLLDGQLDATRFDTVVVAVPAEQAAVLLGPDAALAEAMRLTHSDPCWTVMAAWSDRLPALAGDRRRHDPLGVLSLARCDDARPGRSNVDDIGCRWVLHASPTWTVDHLDAAPADVIADLLRAFARQRGADLGTPVHSAAHRWRYAQVQTPRAEPFGWNASLRLGACGDAWHGASNSPQQRADGMERAWLSGRAIAEKVARD